MEKKYIDSEKLIAEIERRIEINERKKRTEFGDGVYSTCKDFLSLITSIQQEQPEVDLDREIRDYFSKWDYDYYTNEITMDNGIVATLSSIQNVARHFYGLGLNARKEESVSIAESPSKTFPRVNEFDCGSSYRH